MAMYVICVLIKLLVELEEFSVFRLHNKVISFIIQLLVIEYSNNYISND